MALNYKRYLIVMTLMSSLILTACESLTEAPVEASVSENATPKGYYHVLPGDTLYSIAWVYEVDFTTLAERNHLRRPYALKPGQYLNISAPMRETESITYDENERGAVSYSDASNQRWTEVHAAQKTQPKTKWTKQAETQKTWHKPSAHPQKSMPMHTAPKVFQPIPVAKSTPIGRWSWPATGHIITYYAPGKGAKGIDIDGALGSPVRAAADGVVVYQGNGINGYGNLIILKHNQQYLSAYAHNSAVKVKEGQTVHQGQVIALMGKNGQQALLHFEIRYLGKPINPLSVLKG